MGRVMDLDPKSPLAEAYRTVRTNISFADIDNNLITIMFTSTKQNEGKSTTICNVAHAFSRLENTKVLVVDLDLRNPSVHKMFGIGNTYGVMDYLKNTRDLEKCINKVEENIHVLTPGAIPPNPTEILSSKKMQNFIKDVESQYDYVFIDAPPVGIVSDGIIISKYTDGVMFVVGANETDINHTKEVIENMRKSDVNIIGSILNKYDMENNAYGYYGYYYQQDDGKHGRKNKKKKKTGLFGKKKLNSVR